MATTTNYGWTTPDDTALVKDGAAAIRTLGSSVDSTLKTQVDNTVASSIQKTIVDAKGDLIAATAADTVARLAVGSNDQVLVADSTAATGLKWATPAAGGGMTSIASGSFGSNTTNAITLSSIPQTYNSLVLRILNVQMFSGSGNTLLVRVNNEATASQQNTYMVSSGTVIYNSTTASGYRANNYQPPTTNNSGSAEYYFPLYTASNLSKFAQVSSSIEGDDNRFGIAYYSQNKSAITSLVITTQNGNNFNGGTYILYGVK